MIKKKREQRMKTVEEVTPEHGTAVTSQHAFNSIQHKTRSSSNPIHNVNKTAANQWNEDEHVLEVVNESASSKERLPMLKLARAAARSTVKMTVFLLSKVPYSGQTSLLNVYGLKVQFGQFVKYIGNTGKLYIQKKLPIGYKIIQGSYNDLGKNPDYSIIRPFIVANSNRLANFVRPIYVEPSLRGSGHRESIKYASYLDFSGLHKALHNGDTSPHEFMRLWDEVCKEEEKILEGESSLVPLNDPSEEHSVETTTEEVFSVADKLDENKSDTEKSDNVLAVSEIAKLNAKIREGEKARTELMNKVTSLGLDKQTLAEVLELM